MKDWESLTLARAPILVVGEGETDQAFLCNLCIQRGIEGHLNFAHAAVMRTQWLRSMLLATIGLAERALT